MSDPRVVTVGNTLIDHTYHLTNLPGPDEGAFVQAYEQRLGGVETNVAIILSQLGHSTGLISCVADDEDGDDLIDRLDSSSIDDLQIHRLPNKRTSYCLVLTDPDGNRAIIGGGESVLELTLTDTDIATIEAADAVFTSAYAPLEAVERIASLDTPLVYDLAGEFTDLTERGLTRGALDDLAPDVYRFVTNISAARSYLRTDAEPGDCCAQLVARGFEAGAITCGSDGVYLFDEGQVRRRPAFDVEVTDTTGAGDAFTAGLIHAWVLEEMTMDEVIRFASAVGGLNCTVIGAHGGSPTLSDVTDFLD
ncbi:carbohydrate kinase family protein [Natrialba swarupiae]|uniref:Carbohydrate kinase family protein n=1 Tax=Natrialba swarupiae TaxID=2448032 RepID=A0A5D5AM34_9EURY|nr:carbohydrate kinase family protein [Natrialba swarupiae]TYT60530.1 carbohydrate kinase family protein [Natrialba swarupiae]